jgi:hypothetical protein
MARVWRRRSAANRASGARQDQKKKDERKKHGVFPFFNFLVPARTPTSSLNHPG